MKITEARERYVVMEKRKRCETNNSNLTRLMVFQNHINSRLVLSDFFSNEIKMMNYLTEIERNRDKHAPDKHIHKQI
jgi:hypothetical protein